MRQPFTAAEDRYLVAQYGQQTLEAIARALGRGRRSVQLRAAWLCREGRLSPGQRCYGRPWTAAEDTYLSCHWGLRPDGAVAAHLRRTVVACALRAKRRWRQGRLANVHSARQVGRLFGVNGKTVVSWIHRGWLHGERASFAYGTHPVWHIPDGSLQRFAREHAWALDAGRMDPKSNLTTLVRETQAADPCLTVAQAAREVGYCLEILRKHVRAGLLPHRRAPRLYARAGPWQGRIVVRRVDLAPFLARLREGGAGQPVAGSPVAAAGAAGAATGGGAAGQEAGR